MSVTSKHYLAVKLKFRCLKGELELASDILPFRYSPTNETVYKIFLFHFLLGNAIFFTGKNIHLVVLMKSKGKRIRSLIILIGDINLLGEINKSWGLVR